MSPSQQKSSFGCIGVLFGCQSNAVDDIVPPKSRSPTSKHEEVDPSSPITVEDDEKHTKRSSGNQQPPPSPATTEATDDTSLHSVDDTMPDVDDPATHPSSPNSATGNNGSTRSIFRGSSAMEKNIMRVLMSFLLTLLTLGLAGGSVGSGKKAIAGGSSDNKSSATCTKNPDACSTEKKED